MPADRIVSLLGLCLKSGRFAKGDALIPAIQSGKAGMVIASSACGANRMKKLTDKCRSYDIPLFVLDASRYDLLGQKAGNSIAVTDEGFVRSLNELIDQETALNQRSSDPEKGDE